MADTLGWDIPTLCRSVCLIWFVQGLLFKQKREIQWRQWFVSHSKNGPWHYWPAIWIRDAVVLIMMVGNGVHPGAPFLCLCKVPILIYMLHHIFLCNGQHPWMEDLLQFVDRVLKLPCMSSILHVRHLGKSGFKGRQCNVPGSLRRSSWGGVGFLPLPATSAWNLIGLPILNRWQLKLFRRGMLTRWRSGFTCRRAFLGVTSTPAIARLFR